MEMAKPSTALRWEGKQERKVLLYITLLIHSSAKRLLSQGLEDSGIKTKNAHVNSIYC